MLHYLCIVMEDLHKLDVAELQKIAIEKIDVASKADIGSFKDDRRIFDCIDAIKIELEGVYSPEIEKMHLCGDAAAEATDQQSYAYDDGDDYRYETCRRAHCLAMAARICYAGFAFTVRADEKRKLFIESIGYSNKAISLQ